MTAEAKVQGRKLLDAVFGGKYDTAKQILDKNAVDFEAEMGGDNVLHLAARKGKLELIKAMVEKGANIKQTNQNGNTVAHYAAKEGYLDILQYLRTKNFDLNSMNKDGNTPLHVAVIHQPLNVIEKLVDLGMYPNIQNQVTGETPLHTAVSFGRLPAVEGLLIKGAIPDMTDRENRKPEDVARTEELRQAMASYTSLYSALQTGYCQATGLKVSGESVTERQRLDRVAIFIESIDIPKGLPISLYCRREKSENASVSLKIKPEEYVISDLFHIQISDAMHDCAAKFYVPIYTKPPDKEELVLRFINYDEEDKVVDKLERIDGVLHCLVETTLIPETTCVCIVFTRPKQENKAIAADGTILQSEIEPGFKMEIPAEAFKRNSVLSLKVYNSTGEGMNEKVADNRSLITDVFQFNVSGGQPNKSVKMQMPTNTNGSFDAEEMVILTIDERKLDSGVLPEIVQVKPIMVNTNIVFEVSHFCIYVAVPKECIASEDNLKALTRQISDVKNRKKKATFLAMCKKVAGRKHSLLVECGLENRRKERRDKWLSKGYEQCDNCESDSTMLAPGETFKVDVQGSASFENKATSQKRKLVFSQCRSSFQAFAVELDERAYRPADAMATVVVNKQTGAALEEAFALKVQLQIPPAEQPQDIQFEFIEPTNCAVGDDIVTGVMLKNITNADKTVNIRMTLSFVENNVLTKVKEETGETVISPTMDGRRMMIVPPKEYQVKDNTSFEFNLTTHCTVLETNDMYISLEKFALKKPNLEILCDDSLPVGSKSTATLSFTNDTGMILHGGVFNVNAKFIADSKIFNIKKEIESGEQVTAEVNMAPKKVGVWPLTASFKADELTEVTQEKTINVTKK